MTSLLRPLVEDLHARREQIRLGGGQEKIDKQQLTGEGRPRHLDGAAQCEFPVPEPGEHDLEPSSNANVWPVPLVIK